MLLPSHTTLSKEVSQTKLGFQLEQLKLNYIDIKDFTAIKYTFTFKKINGRTAKQTGARDPRDKRHNLRKT